MARTKRHPAWIWKVSDFQGDANAWWKRYQEKRYNRPIGDVIAVMNRKGEGDGIMRNAPAHYRRMLVREFRAKQNQTLRNVIAQNKDLDAIIIEPRQRRSANWLWF